MEPVEFTGRRGKPVVNKVKKLLNLAAAAGNGSGDGTGKG
jgi:hypothetical protein